MSPIFIKFQYNPLDLTSYSSSTLHQNLSYKYHDRDWNGCTYTHTQTEKDRLTDMQDSDIMNSIYGTLYIILYWESLMCCSWVMWQTVVPISHIRREMLMQLLPEPLAWNSLRLHPLFPEGNKFFSITTNNNWLWLNLQFHFSRSITSLRLFKTRMQNTWI